MKTIRMKRFYFSLLAVFLFFLTSTSQSAADAAVRITVSVQSSPPQISLSWPNATNTSQYLVYRKLKTSFTWGTVLATLSPTSTVYIDNTALANVNYEYRVIRVGNGFNGYGYVNSGIDVAAIEQRGNLILVIDSSFTTSLSQEITRLVKDLEGDGWEVHSEIVSRYDSVSTVKSKILNAYALDPSSTKAVFLFGRIPVPYSGNINPDGHPDHLGAWPADVYYGDMDGIWTDVSMNSTSAASSRHHNIPGDGKFDQSLVPGEAELQVGRVDFYNLPTFTLTEQQLLKNYLDKDHEYRHKIYVPEKRAVIDDNFGYFSGEAFAASAHKNFGPLVGTTSVVASDYFTSMTGNSYLWSYGCGGGSYTSAGGIGNTAGFSNANLQGVFTMLFGSYFGDWDSQNNFLRAPLAQGRILTNLWSGRPHYQLHHMGLGENIGYGLIQTQNNPAGLYFASSVGITGKWIHNALMGDPTLRNDVVVPVSGVVATKSGFNCVINWNSSSDTSVIGYYLYSRNDSSKIYSRINSQVIVGNSYVDSCLLYPGIYEYMVRALKLESTPSGTYYNLSQGISDTAFNSNNFASIAAFTYTNLGISVSFNASSTLNPMYSWSFGNGQTAIVPNPTITYTANGIYTVQLIATHPCITDSSNSVFQIFEVSLNENQSLSQLLVFPNPTRGNVTIQWENETAYEIEIYTSEGKRVYSCSENRGSTLLDLSGFSKGLYLIKFNSNGKSELKPLLLY